MGLRNSWFADLIQLVDDVSDESKAAIAKAANAVAKSFNSRVLVYGGEIDNAGIGRLLEALQLEKRSKPNIFLILTTNGGDAHAAYRIARLLQLISDRFFLFVPFRCKSAGTLLALGAHELIMHPIAELGPLDVQLAQRNEIDTTRSGLVVRTALEGLAEETLRTYEKMMLAITFKSGGSVSFEVASQVAASMATGVMSPVYAQIRPEDLGNDLRDLHIATAYGTRLIRHGKNATREAVRQLVEDYPAHGFIIDAVEAKSLFTTVAEPQEIVLALASLLGGSLSIDATSSPCFVERLDTEEESSGEAEHGEGAQDATGADPTVDGVRNGHGSEDQGGGRAAGQRRAVPETKRKSA